MLQVFRFLQGLITVDLSWADVNVEACVWKAERRTYKRHGAVVDEEVLNLDAPVWSESEVPSTLWRPAHVAVPGIDFLHLVKGPRADQDLQAVLTETSGRDKRTTQRRSIRWTHSVRRSWSWAAFTCSSWRCHTEWPRGRRSTRCSTTGSRLRRSDTAFQRSSPANSDNAVSQHWWWCVLRMEVRHLQSGLGWSQAHVDVGKDKSLGC